MRTTTFTLEAKQIGRRAALVPSWKLDLEYVDRLNLRDLLTRVVIEEVQAFQTRQRDARLVRVLTETQIQDGLEAGKIDTLGREYQQEVNAAEAVRNALQSFEDGLYYVFIGNEQITSLEQQILFRPQMDVLFLRLVALAGG
jgi:hypothetical protein